jgi:threonine/homoserine/homoserine lactone efflux protein
MVAVETLILFFPVALLLVVTPGPDFVFVTATSAIRGTRAGLFATAGICLAMMVHVTLAGLGIAEIIYRYPLAFEITRYLGAGYLLHLAWKALRSARPQTVDVAGAPALSQDLSYATKGFLTNLLNPKAAIITSLVFIQFIDLSAGSVFPKFLMLGIVITAQMFAVYSVISITTGRVQSVIVGRSWFAKVADRVIGAMFIGFAVRLLLMERVR